jgi:hypothetical protein
VFIAKWKSRVTDGGQRHWRVGQPDGSKHLVCKHECIWRSTQHGACFDKSLPWPWWQQSGNLDHTIKIVTWALCFQCQYFIKDYLTSCVHNLAKPPLSLASRHPYLRVILPIKRKFEDSDLLVCDVTEWMLPEFWEEQMSAGTHPVTEHYIPEDWHHELHCYKCVKLNQKKKFAFYHLLTNSKGCSSHKLCFLWTPNIPCHNHKSVPQDPVLSHVNPVHILKACS